MPNTHANITDLFDDIADAIRERDETTDPIVADTFPSRIRAIPSGGGVNFLPINLSLSVSGQSVEFGFVKLINYDKLCITTICGNTSVTDFAGNEFLLNPGAVKENVPLAQILDGSGDYLLFYPSSASDIPFSTTSIYQRIGSALSNTISQIAYGYTVNLSGTYNQGDTINSIILVKAIRSMSKFVVFGALVLKNPITLTGSSFIGQFSAQIGES